MQTWRLCDDAASINRVQLLALRITRVLATHPADGGAFVRAEQSTRLQKQLLALWSSAEFRTRYVADSFDAAKFSAPKLLLQCLLAFFRSVDSHRRSILVDALTYFRGIVRWMRVS